VVGGKNLTRQFCKGWVRLNPNFKANNYEWILLEVKHGMQCRKVIEKNEKTFFMKENVVNHKRVKTCWITTERQQGNGRNEWPQCLIIILCGISLT
jgi:hypothetical protein